MNIFVLLCPMHYYRSFSFRLIDLLTGLDTKMKEFEQVLPHFTKFIHLTSPHISKSLEASNSVLLHEGLFKGNNFPTAEGLLIRSCDITRILKA